MFNDSAITQRQGRKPFARTEGILCAVREKLRFLSKMLFAFIIHLTALSDLLSLSHPVSPMRRVLWILRIGICV
ncbi:MAG: hypothetical protein QM647_01775 [Asticcacaulis sp.]|uniref:hypothetical protein n=1 Tax=Asticcacaulis sp. TaxID=1872648 RepID=UPI0039E36A31